MSYLRLAIIVDGKECAAEDLILLGVEEARFQAQRLADSMAELAHQMHHSEDEECEALEVANLP